MRKVFILALMAGCFSRLSAQNLGFENNLTGWTTNAVGTFTSTSSVNTFRTGSKGVQVITTPNSSDISTLRNDVVTTTVTQTGRFVHVLGYARATNNSGAQARIGIVDQNGNTRYASSWSNLSSTNFLPLAGVFQTEIGSTYRVIVAAKTANATQQTIRMDDIFIYQSSSSAHDATSPEAPSAVEMQYAADSSIVNFKFATAQDNINGSGIAGMVIGRTNSLSNLAPTPLNQCLYSANPINGANILPFNFVVRYSGAAITSFSDTLMANTNYTYLFFMRDAAGNYTQFGGARALVVASNVTVSNEIPTDGLLIRGARTVTINSSGNILLRKNASAFIYGKLLNSNGRFTTDSVGMNYKVNFFAGSEFEFASSGQLNNLPKAQWDAASTCRVTGITNANALDNLNQQFGNFIWTCPNQTSNLELTVGFGCNGNFELNRTGTGRLTFATNSATKFAASFTHNNGNVVFGDNHTAVFNGIRGQQIKMLNTPFEKLEISNTNAVKGMVQLNSNMAVKKELNMQTGGLRLSKYSVELNGIIKGTEPFFTMDSSNIIFNSNIPNTQHELYVAAEANVLSRLMISLPNDNSTVQLKNQVRIAGGLFVNSGTLLTNENITFLSRKDSTAYVAPVGGKINGKVTVERFIPAQGARGYRMVSAPVYGGSIFNNWQEAGANRPGYGLFVTGAGTNNGFDAGSTSASAFRYDGSINPSSNVNTTRFVPIANTNNGNVSTGNGYLTPGTGYLLFVRGDRNPANFNVANSSNTILRATGTLQTGTVQFKADNSGTDGTPIIDNQTGRFTLIANPYQATIDWANNQIVKSRLSNSYWVWDPTINNNAGGWAVVSFNSASRTYSVTPSTSQVSTRIQAGQAFLIYTTGTNASLTIPENAKVTTNAARLGTVGFRGVEPTTEIENTEAEITPIANTIMPSVSIQLMQQVGNKNVLADEAVANYHTSFSNALVASEDVVKMSNNFGENIAIVKSGRNITIDRNQKFATTDTIQLALFNTKVKTYTLKLAASQFAENATSAIVVDRFTNKQQQINFLDDNDAYTFSITADSNSRRVDRLYIIFNPKANASNVITTNKLVVSPNLVTNNNVHISYKSSSKMPTSLSLTNAEGLLIKTANKGNIDVIEEDLFLENITSGMYYITITNGIEKFTKTIIKQ